MLAARAAFRACIAIRSPLVCASGRRYSRVLAPSMSSGAVGASKRKMPAKVGTHSGTFHCDEALGCFLLRQTPDFAEAEIVRTRDPKTLQDLDVVIDVGGTYEPDAKRFDHHQRGFEEVFGHGFSTKLSSAGLVYKHYGRSIIARLLKQSEDAADTQTVYLAVYKHFMEAIDGIDNGVNQWPSEGQPRYLSSTHLSARVGGLNPRWNQDASDSATAEQFAKAMALTGSEFLECVDYISESWLPARSIVQQALDGREGVDASGQIIELSGGGVPWKEHLYELEKQAGVEGLVKFCIYEDTREQKWRVQAVSVAPGSFENRRSLLAPWRGLRDEALSQASGIPGCVFVHASGFIGGANTREGALALAVKSL